MPNTMEIFIIALLAACGAIARFLNKNAEASYKGMVSGCLVAAFTGVVIYFLMRHFDVSKSLTYAAAGISGWIGPNALDMVASAVMSKAGMEREKKEGTEEEIDDEQPEDDYL